MSGFRVEEEDVTSVDAKARFAAGTETEVSEELAEVMM